MPRGSSNLFTRWYSKYGAKGKGPTRKFQPATGWCLTFGVVVILRRDGVLEAEAGEASRSSRAVSEAKLAGAVSSQTFKALNPQILKCSREKIRSPLAAVGCDWVGAKLRGTERAFTNSITDPRGVRESRRHRTHTEGGGGGVKR